MKGFPVITGVQVLALLCLLLVGCRESTQKDPEATKKMEVSKDPESPAPVTQQATPPFMIKGKILYTSHCLVCHQVTGGGVSGLNPPLKGTEYVLGDKARLVGILLHGSNTGLEINGETYSNVMPGFGMLSDQEIADIASYIRNSFGNTADPLTELEVAAIRAGN